MQLKYRGLVYEATVPPVKMVDAVVSACFRGQSYLIHRPVQASVSGYLAVQTTSMAAIALKFRGCAYLPNF
jgi:hypothetical protein